MSEAGLDGFVGNPVRVIGKSSEEEIMQIASLTFYWLIFVTYSAFGLMLVDASRIKLKPNLQYPGD